MILSRCYYKTSFLFLLFVFFFFLSFYPLRLSFPHLFRNKSFSKKCLLASCPLMVVVLSPLPKGDLQTILGLSKTYSVATFNQYFPIKIKSTILNFWNRKYKLKCRVQGIGEQPPGLEEARSQNGQLARIVERVPSKRKVPSSNPSQGGFFFD